MKATLFLIICLLSKEAFSQIAIAQTVSGSQTGYLGIPAQIYPSVALNNYQYNLNANRYLGEYRDISEINGVIPFSEKYSFKEFLDGNLIFKSGNKSQVVKMNYHQLYGEMQFLDKKGDTLFVADNDSIAFVRFEKALYLHITGNGYFKIMSGNHYIKLCSQQKLELNKGYNNPGNITVHGPADYLVISSKEYFYLVDKEVKYEANKAGFQKAFPKHKQQIKVYLKKMARQQTPIKFYKEDDLVSLFKFCASLL